MIRDIPPSLYSFLAGVTASAAVNLITNVSSGEFAFGQVARHVELAVPWIGASAALAFVASLAERFDRTMAARNTDTLSGDEIEEVRNDEFLKVRTGVRLGLAATVVCLLISFAVVNFPAWFPATTFSGETKSVDACLDLKSSNTRLPACV